MRFLGKDKGPIFMNVGLVWFCGEEILERIWSRAMAFDT
jgi:hypothetical protein